MDRAPKTGPRGGGASSGRSGAVSSWRACGCTRRLLEARGPGAVALSLALAVTAGLAVAGALDAALANQIQQRRPRLEPWPQSQHAGVMQANIKGKGQRQTRGWCWGKRFQ